MTLAPRRWMPTSMLDIEKHTDTLPPISVAIFELGRWCFESLFAQQTIPTTEDFEYHVKPLPPRYVSGVSQWGDIKTDRAFIHANRMWIALRLVDMIHKFVGSIRSQGGQCKCARGHWECKQYGARGKGQILRYAQQIASAAEGTSDYRWKN